MKIFKYRPELHPAVFVFIKYINATLFYTSPIS